MDDILFSEKQKWQINEPYEHPAIDLQFLVDNPLNKKNVWKLNLYKPIKDKIRDYYYEKQNNICAYCRLPIKPGTGNIEIEHIIDKNNREDFTFEPRNLVVSCHNCNFSKSDRKVMIECPPPNTYPTSGEKFKIIHGHFDNYFDNIEILEGSIYHAKKDKGTFTIIACDLTREGLVLEREEVEMYQDDPIISLILKTRKAENNNTVLSEVSSLLMEFLNNNNVQQ